MFKCIPHSLITCYNLTKEDLICVSKPERLYEIYFTEKVFLTKIAYAKGRKDGTTRVLIQNVIERFMDPDCLVSTALIQLLSILQGQKMQ